MGPFHKLAGTTIKFGALAFAMSCVPQDTYTVDTRPMFPNEAQWVAPVAHGRSNPTLRTFSREPEAVSVGKPGFVSWANPRTECDGGADVRRSRDSVGNLHVHTERTAVVKTGLGFSASSSAVKAKSMGLVDSLIEDEDRFEDENRCDSCRVASVCIINRHIHLAPGNHPSTPIVQPTCQQRDLSTAHPSLTSLPLPHRTTVPLVRVVS